jgi:hypothetical protein
MPQFFSGISMFVHRSCSRAPCEIASTSARVIGASLRVPPFCGGGPPPLLSPRWEKARRCALRELCGRTMCRGRWRCVVANGRAAERAHTDDANACNISVGGAGARGVSRLEGSRVAHHLYSRTRRQGRQQQGATLPAHCCAAAARGGLLSVCCMLVPAQLLAAKTAPELLPAGCCLPGGALRCNSRQAAAGAGCCC